MTDRELIKMGYRYETRDGSASEEINIRSGETGWLLTYSRKNGSETTVKHYPLSSDAAEQLQTFIMNRRMEHIPGNKSGNNVILLGYGDGSMHSVDLSKIDDPFDLETCLRFRDLLYGLMKQDVSGHAYDSPDLIMIAGEGITLTFRLNENGASRELCELVNHEHDIFRSGEDFAFHPDEPLDVSDCPRISEGRRGMLGYDARNNEVRILTRDQACDGLCLLGKTEDDPGRLYEDTFFIYRSEDE